MAYPLAAPGEVGALVDLELGREGAEHVCGIAGGVWGGHEDCFGGVEAVEDLFGGLGRHCRQVLEV